MESKFNQRATTPSTTLIMHDSIPDFEADNKVLLIEDNPGDARLVEILLGESSDILSCKIVHRKTLAEGLTTLAHSDDFAAILLDLSLPDSQGFETLKQLLSRFPNNNVIVLTGHTDKILGVKAVKAGAQDFLVKGLFDADLLAKTLRFSIERNSVLKRLEETQHLAHIGNWEYNDVNQLFAASDETYRIFGYTPRKDIFTYKDVLNKIHPFHIFYKIHQETLASPDNVYSKDIKIQQINGKYREVFIQCSLNKNVDNYYFFSGIIQDITERKQAEREANKSRALYQHIFSKSRDAIYIGTYDGMLQDFNKATAELTGYSQQELQTFNVRELFEDSIFWDDFVEKLKASKALKDIEVNIQHRNGDTLYCLLTASPLESEDFVGYNGILRDITERKHAEELRKARDVARQSAQMKEQFIASISHEMRTPMNAILGMSNLLLKTERLGEEQFNYVNSIKHSSEILLGIVNDILEIATLQNGKIRFENDDFDLHELLANLVNVMQYKVDEKDLHFELNIDEQLPKYLKGDKLRLNQILYNLVGNAIKFTDMGHVLIQVEQLNESAGSVHIKFMVEDTGVGIPEEKLGAIFDTFTRIRTKERLFEGTGLGLSIAKNLVEYQGGKIWAESELGKGSKFFFDLILEAGSMQEIKELPPKEINSLLEDNAVFELLLVEDHPMNRFVAQKTLERQWQNIKITIAENGQLAVDLLKERGKPFDIVLMDIQMPILDGYETTLYIRNNMPPQLANMPILAMTAHAHIAKDEKFKEYGMNDFVLKPFEPEQLFEKISKYVKH